MCIPNDVKIKMQNFTHAIRNRTDNKAISMYREFIVANIRGVIENTFPYFNTYASDELKNELVETFLKKNKSSDPAFHQIATELLKCSKMINIPEKLAKLIEFEWLVFDTEIADCAIDNNHCINQATYEDIINLGINPSLEIISLPFDISELGNSKSFFIEESFFYCIYHNADHIVNFQKITQLEYVLISSLVSIGIATFTTEDFNKIQDK